MVFFALVLLPLLDGSAFFCFCFCFCVGGKSALLVTQRFPFFTYTEQ